MAQHDENVVWHAHPVTQQQREQHHGHRGVVLWFTGLSGSGKSTVAGALEEACMSAASAPICWTAITCAMACAATWDSAMRIAKRTFAASVKWPG
jgi:predicted ATPase